MSRFSQKDHVIYLILMQFLFGAFCDEVGQVLVNGSNNICSFSFPMQISAFMDEPEIVVPRRKIKSRHGSRVVAWRALRYIDRTVIQTYGKGSIDRLFAANT